MKKQLGYKFPNARQFADELHKGNVEGVYLFLGTEETEKEHYVSRMAQILFGQNEPSISRFHCEAGDLASAARYCVERDMFSPLRIAVLYSVDLIKDKSEAEIFSSLVSDHAEEVTVILMSRETSHPRIITKDLEENIRTVVFWPPFENELSSIINSRLRDAKRPISPDAVKVLLSLTGRDLGKVESAIERIISGSDGPVSVETITDLLTDQRETTVFEFIEALFLRSAQVLKLLKKLTDDGVHELQILALINREAERIEKYHSIRARGISHDEAISDLKIPTKGVDPFTAHARAFDAAAIRRMLILIPKADQAAKSTRYGDGILSNPLAEIIEEALCGKKS